MYYPQLIKIKNDVKDKWIPAESKKKFLPANAIEGLVTNHTVSMAFREIGVAEEGERQRLTQSVVGGRQRLFLILVLMTSNSNEKLSSLRGKEWNEISDLSLPLVASELEFTHETNSGKAQFTPNNWIDIDLTLFQALQWHLLSPVFGTADKFIHNLDGSHILPYLQMSAGPKSSGFFGEVYRAEIHVAHIDPEHIPAENANIDSNSNSVAVAIKRAKDDRELIDFFDKEAQNLQRVQKVESKHIIKPIAAYKWGIARCLLFPWAHGGNLATYWKEHDQTRHELGNLRWIMEQLVGRHGDLKPENILWFKDNNEEGCLKIADMGLATFHDENANTMQRNMAGIITKTPSGTFRYEPPEMDQDRASGKPRSRQYDVWSMGCIIIDLLVWLLYGFDALEKFRKDTTQIWERTPTRYYVSSYIDACLDVMEEALGEDRVYRKVLNLVRSRVLIIDVSEVYKSSVHHREIASVLHGSLKEIQQQPDSLYKIPDNLSYPHADIEARKIKYFRPHSEGGRLAAGPPTERSHLLSAELLSHPIHIYLYQNRRTDKKANNIFLKEPTKLDDVWESIPDNNFASMLFNSLSWDTVKPPTARGHDTLCSNCNTINSAYLFKPEIHRDELESSSQGCALCRLLYDALVSEENELPVLISLRQNGSVVSINNGPNLLSVYCDPGQNIFPGAQLGLPKLPDHGSREQFLLLKEWIRVCDTSHRSCYRFDTEEADEKPISTLPTRLVELGNPLRLVKSEYMKISSYVALSHCWGTTKTLCTTSENITQFMESIDFTSLPKTFRDAIQVTRGIGIKYLWIDSLCIIQDDDDDWEHESTQMEKVFSFAYCTIGVSSSKSSVEGFLHKRCPRSCIQLETAENGTLYVCRNIDNFHRDVDLGELNSRGWVLQERALSRRSIFYTTTQVYWECGAGIHCETLARLKNAKAALLGDAKFPNSALEYYRDGRQMLVQDLYERYSRLDFTHYWDRPVAILGLQERLAKAFKTKGAYGLFATYFPRLLLWKRFDTHYMTRIKQGSGTHRCAPTWSWFSKVGAIKYLELKFQEIDWATNDFINPLESSFSSSWRMADANGVAITLRGQARKLNLPKIELARYATLDEREDADAAVNDLRCVVIGRDKGWSNPGDIRYHTLIIRRVNSGCGSDVYERAGVASLKPEHVAREGLWTTIQ
ncbi:hypothetical protein F4680DRAFT_459176 [Xylaria scruposa]|nr:hypothetical protein F4680DRAFT_459176 [Xylaria scruposa]